MAFSCTKGGRSYFHKTAKPEEKVFCPFHLVYAKYQEMKVDFNGHAIEDSGFYFLQKFKSLHNHPIDTQLATSDLWNEVPQTVKAGKFCVLTADRKIGGQITNECRKQLNQS